MPLITSQQINKYYDLYKQVAVNFNKQIIQILGLLPKEVFLKCVGKHFPCIIYSASMVEAKVIANLRASSLQTIQQAGNSVSLRSSFKLSDKKEPLSFFISSKITGYNLYDKENSDLYFISLTYTQKPPDDLIALLGELLEANVNAKRRKEVRIDINPASIKGLSLDSRDATLCIESKPIKCIVRDLSFLGAKVLIFGTAKSLVNNNVVLQLSFSSQKDLIKLPGKVLRFEEVQDRKDIASAAILFEEDKIPLQYKMYINEYLRSKRI